MFSKSFLIFFIGTLAHQSVTGDDYCNEKLCDFQDGKTYKHIACENSGEFLETCPEDANIVLMTEDLQNLIISISNQMREKIAGGDIRGYQPAARMPVVHWDDELAELAVLNVKQCEAKKDECLNTEKCTYAGQNIELSTGVTVFEDVADEFVGILHSWFNEYKLADVSVIDNFYKSELSWERFTLMVNHKVDKIGCAASTFTSLGSEQNRTAILMTCNYGYRNILDEPVYIAGEPCSKCDFGCSEIYKSLCSEDEVVIPIPDIFLQKIKVA